MCLAILAPMLLTGARGSSLPHELDAPVLRAPFDRLVRGLWLRCAEAGGRQASGVDAVALDERPADGLAATLRQRQVCCDAADVVCMAVDGQCPVSMRDE